jgi:hypothetical protein
MRQSPNTPAPIIGVKHSPRRIGGSVTGSLQVARMVEGNVSTGQLLESNTQQAGVTELLRGRC